MTTRLNSAVLSSRLWEQRALVLSLFLSAAVLYAGSAFAQTPANIIFPVAELENCASKEDCHAYCDLPEHFGACRAFAKKHNLRDDSGRGEDRFDVILRDGGPGQCAVGADDPHESCRSYCDSASNMRECVAYAKTHGLMRDEELAEAKKILAALDRGVPLPTACTDKTSCKAVCEAPPNVEAARQCFVFAEAAGLLPPGVDREKAETVFRAIEEGRAPFKTPQEFQQCDNPQNDETLQKCVDFAAQHGFLSLEEAEMVKKTGSKGPGGCRGEKECRAYCSTHRDECFTFAEQHNLLRPEARARAIEMYADHDKNNYYEHKNNDDVAGKESFKNREFEGGFPSPYSNDRVYLPPAGISHEQMERMMREREAQYRLQYGEQRPRHMETPPREQTPSEQYEQRYESYQNKMTPEERERYESIRQQYDQGQLEQSDFVPERAEPQTRGGLLAAVLSVVRSLLEQ